MSSRATQDGRVMEETSDKTWSTGEENGKPLQYSCLENPMSSMKKQEDMTLKDVLPRSVGAQYATGDQWRNNSWRNEGTEPKKKQHPVVDVTGDGSKVWCCKEQYCIGTWNVRSMNQGKLEVVKLEMARVNTDILEFDNKDFMVWSTVSSRSCFCWLYRSSSSLAAENIISVILVLTIWWCPCVESSLVLLEEGVCYDQCIVLAELC